MIGGWRESAHLDVVADAVGAAHLEEDAVVDDGHVGVVELGAHHDEPLRAPLRLRRNGRRNMRRNRMKNLRNREEEKEEED